MSKIFLSNFPYLSERVTAQKSEEPAIEVAFVHGFNIGLLSGDVIYPRLASDILQAILVHDTVVIELHNIDYITQIFGLTDTIKLLQSGCLEVIEHGGFTPALRQDGSKYEVIFVRDGGSGQSGAYLGRVERNLRKIHPTSTNEVNVLLLRMEKHQKTLDSQGTTEILQKEIDYDLQNQNITVAQGISSKQHTEIVPSDIYKVLRLLFINKSLFLSNAIGAVALRMDGAVESVLKHKLSPVVQSGNVVDTVAFFQKILEEKQIPDLARLYFGGVLKIDDVLRLRENINGQRFRDWYLTTHYDPKIVRQTLLSKGIPQSILTKLLRFIIPNAIGVASPALGLAASTIDSFVIDSLLGGWHPNIFLDDVLKSEIDACLRQHARGVRRASIKSRFPNVGRNDPCPCGSTKKFKRCCGSEL